MSEHEHVAQTLRAVIGELENDGILDLSPTSVALRGYARYGKDDDNAHVRYGCIEHFKQLARGILARQFGPDGDESVAHQGDMFSGHLQTRYPIPHKAGEQPIYRPRETLSDADLEWNIRSLRKSASARLQHADALQAYRDARNNKIAA